MQAPASQVWPGLQPPQEPPQPSEPQTKPVQSGVQEPPEMSSLPSPDWLVKLTVTVPVPDSSTVKPEVVP